MREDDDHQQQQRFRHQRPRSEAEWRALLQWLLFDDEGRQTPWDTRLYGKLPGVPGYWVHRKVLDEFGGPAHVCEILAARAIAKPAASWAPAPKMNGFVAH